MDFPCGRPRIQRRTCAGSVLACAGPVLPGAGLCWPVLALCWLCAGSVLALRWLCAGLGAAPLPANATAVAMPKACQTRVKMHGP